MKGYYLEVFFWIVLTVLFWGTAPILEKIGLNKAPIYLAVTVRTIAIAVFVFSGALVTGQFTKIGQLDTKTILFVIMGGLFAGLFGQITYFMALRQAEASRVVPLTMAFPLVTALLGIWLLNESLTWQKGFGALCIIIGSFLLTW
jgi:transporter family protein